MLVDVFSDRYVKSGVAERREAHRRGLWHRVFSCLVVNLTSGTAFLQRKAPGQYVFDRPDFLDVSIGGHYEAGERIEEGVREIREELGLDAAFADLVPIGVRQTAATLAPDHIANEFQHVFLLPIARTLEEMPVPGEEVHGLVEVALDESIELLLSRQAELAGRSRVFTAGSAQPIQPCVIRRESFPPGYLEIDCFFLRLFIAASRLRRGEDPRRIFW